MKCWANLWGGASYVWEEEPTEYPSLRSVIEEYDGRFHDRRYPVWGDRSVYGLDERGNMTVGHIFFDDPDGSGDAYPDRILVLGPRNGLHLERT